jgi:phage shock protein A
MRPSRANRIATSCSAEARVMIGEATTGLGEEMSDVGIAIQRAQDKTEQMQARAAAVNELVDTGAIDDLTAPAGSDLDAQIAALTAGTQVDAEMAKLRAEVGTGTPAPELSQGAEAADSGEESK